MKPIVFLVALLVACSDGRPSRSVDQGSATLYQNVDSFIIGGSNAAVGAWPWQLSQQRLGTAWSHSCGASLLSARYALSASHCVDGAAVSSLRVIAGLNDRSNTAGTQTVNLSGYKMHEQYNQGTGTYANDIAILTHATLVTMNANVRAAELPPNNNNLFAGATCVITGWGRTSSSNTLPNILQQANVGILSTAQCQSQGTGATITANHICIYDSTNARGACNGDSGGPVNCPGGNSYLVAGVASFVFQTAGNCLPSRPSVYTRSGSYLAWITTNTP